MSNLPEIYRVEFANLLDLALQQKDSRFESTVSVGSHKGKQASPIEYVGKVEARKRTGRDNPMDRVDANFVRRWVFPEAYDLPQRFDNLDIIKTMIDPKSKALEAAKAALNRAKDAEILEKLFGDNKIGENGTTNVTFDSNMVVQVNHGASGNVGLTVAKLKAGKKMLKQNHVDVDTDPIYCPITAQQEEDLLNEATVISLDYNDKPVLVEGRLKRFLGINFFDSEMLPVDGSGYRRVPLYTKSGLYLGKFDEIHVDISQRKDIRGLPWQIYVEGTFGATRTDESRVIEIKCLEP